MDRTEAKRQMKDALRLIVQGAKTLARIEGEVIDDESCLVTAGQSEGVSKNGQKGMST